MTAAYKTKNKVGEWTNKTTYQLPVFKSLNEFSDIRIFLGLCSLNLARSAKSCTPFFATMLVHNLEAGHFNKLFDIAELITLKPSSG